MERTQFRLLIVADEKLEHRIDTFNQAIELLRQDYEVVDGLTLSYKIEYRSYVDVPWEDYWGDGKSFGLNLGWIAKENARIKRVHGLEFASVVYVVSQENWKAPGFGGWNIGRFYSGMSVQIIKQYNTVRSIYLVLSMEVMHCLNEQIYRETGVKLKDFFNVRNYDYGIVHGEE